MKLGLYLTVGVASILTASAATFSVDTNRSSLTISGFVIGNPIREQGPGSLTTSFGGTINANVTDSAITFTGGSGLDALTNGVWEPSPTGGAGSAPGDYGAMVNTFFAAVKASFRNLLVDMNSGAIPITNGQFDSSTLVFSFSTNGTSSFDYNAGFLGSGSRPLTGLSTNRPVGLAMVGTTNGVQTLTLNVDTEFQFRAISDNDSTARLLGQLVSTRTLEAVSLPRFVGAIVTNGVFEMRLEAPATGFTLESSTNFVTWSPSVASTPEPTVYRVPATNQFEFFRLKQ